MFAAGAATNVSVTSTVVVTTSAAYSLRSSSLLKYIKFNFKILSSSLFKW